MTKSRAFSAPGKALIAGGYLVLDPSYNAYVTALSSRMHAVVKQGLVSESSTIVIKSPQFESGEWIYEIASKNYVDPPKGISNSRNPFLEATISTVLSYVNPVAKFNIDITIFSDPGYHSQDETECKKSNTGNKQFLYHKKKINDVAKTGLGSSAGLVSVVTNALLSFFKVELNENIVHNAAQIAHCYAQKKIGSGFDVATAVYGSIIYRRFQPDLINQLFEHEVYSNLDDIELQKSYIKDLSKVIESNWDFNHLPCVLPPKIKLLMGDIRGGSETPKMVSKILKWKNENVSLSSDLYEKLNQSNEDLIESLSNLHKLYEDDPEKYAASIKYFKSRSLSSIESYLSIQPELKLKLGPFLSLIESFKSIRSNFRKLTRYSHADVEPQPQTILLNNCNTLKGCLGGVVPGAGGYDAICLLVIENAIEELIGTSSKDKRFQNVKWLDLHEEAEGIIEENVDDYIGLL